MSRLLAERAFHQAQARQRWQTLAQEPQRLAVDADAYLNHESWIRFAFGLMGEVAGLRVLDYGCGHGIAGVLFAQRGAEVVAFDLAGGYVAEARTRASGLAGSPPLRWYGVEAAAERLPFADASFDRVWAHAVLHHVDLPLAAPELRRVLRPGGYVVAAEPWGGNPLLNIARQRCSYPHKDRSADEQPLRSADLRLLRRYFTHVAVYPQQLFGMVRRCWPGVPGKKWLDRLDTALLRRLPFLGMWARYLVLRLAP
jgi:SAM-dependent methyltransferase